MNALVRQTIKFLIRLVVSLGLLTWATSGLVGGKQVVNIVPKGAPDKGRAVERARQEMKCDKVIYVGDDKTDEDVFAMARRGRTLTIRVGASRSSSAHFYIRDQREIDRLLKTLIELRSDRLKR